MHVKDMFLKWTTFKEMRKKNCALSDKNENFITMRGREKMIDLLFEEIERMKNV